MGDVRSHSISILTEFDLTGKQLKLLRDKYCSIKNISGTDRQRLTALTNDVTRFRGRLDYWIKCYLSKPRKKVNPDLLNILRAGFYEIVMDNRIPSYAAVNTYVELCKKRIGSSQSKLVNALLRKATKIDRNNKPENCSEHDWDSFPQWLWKKWNKQFGEEKTKRLVAYFNQLPAYSIRRNRIHLNEQDFYSFCLEKNITVERWPDSDRFYHISKQLSGLQPLLISHKVFVQDRGAGRVVEMLDPKPGETILDVCAAPGTKSQYIAELMNGEGILYSSDIQANRMNAFRPEIPNIKIDIKNACEDDFPVADGILIDVPCSGTGVIRKKPDIRWRRRPDEMKVFRSLQVKILSHMTKFLKPGARIVYATCSLEPEENWGVVEAFLKLNDHFTIQKETNNGSGSWFDDKGAFSPFPPITESDGMFAVKLIHEK